MEVQNFEHLNFRY